MSKLKPFLLGSIVGAGCIFVALQYHVVQTHDGFQFVPRTPQHSLGLAYADVREWTAEQWADRPELARAMVAHGSSDIIAASVAEDLADSITSENSTLDRLKTFITEDSEDKPLDTMFGLPGISDPNQDSTSSNDNSNDSLIPFPRASQGSSTPDAFADSDSSTTTDRTSVARRSPLSIDNVFGSDSDSESNTGYGTGTSFGSTSEGSSGSGYETTSSTYGSGNTYGSGTGRSSSRLNSSGNSYSSDNSYGSGSSYGANTNRDSSSSYGSGTTYGSGTGSFGSSNSRDSDSSYHTGNNSEADSTDYGSRSNRRTKKSWAGDSGFGQPDSSRDLSGSRFDRDASETEGMLFGDAEIEDEDSSSSSYGSYSPGSDNTWGGSSRSDDASSGSDTGVFGGMTEALDRRAADALARARSGFADEANSAFNEGSEAVGDYFRERTSETFGSTRRSSGLFSNNGSSTTDDTPHAVRALKEGFDPFLDWGE